MKTYSINLHLPENIIESIEVKQRTTFLDLAIKYQKSFDCKIVGAVFNNELCELKKEVSDNGNLELITLRQGWLSFLSQKSVLHSHKGRVRDVPSCDTAH